jgi:crotonobetainyl-CoA:carnitine CoA-transferase CaiB-like acyl-CoA transferase
MMLGDAGAEVIKVEPPSGDETRAWGPPYLAGESAYYLACNRNKRSIALDLRRPEGRQVVLDLARRADVLIENFKLGTMERWGLDYEGVLQAENPRLVYCSISGFGRTGPYAAVPGYDFVVQGMGGLMSITGERSGGPLKVGVAVADLTTGMMAAFGILAALRHRDLTGRGQRVDLSLLETQVAWLANVASNYLVLGQVPTRLGNAHPNIVPYQTLRARDRELIVAVGNDQQFQRLCAALDLPQLAQDPRYATNAARVANREALIPLLEQALAGRDATEWVERFWQAGIPAGPINSLDHVFTDPQVLHREMLVRVPHPTAGEVPQVGLPIKFGATPGSIRRHPPLLGEQTREILAEQGYTEQQIAALAQAGAIKP